MKNRDIDRSQRKLGSDSIPALYIGVIFGKVPKLSETFFFCKM